MRVALCDDSALFRSGLAMLLQVVDIEVAFEARSADELMARLPTHDVDVVVLDIRMPPTFTDEGLVAAERIRERHPQVGILVLSTYTDTSCAVRLLQELSTSVGYLLKDRVSDTSELRDALDRLHRGETVIEPDIVRQLVRRRERRTGLQRLTEQELRILTLLAEGRSNAGIGAAMYLSTKTVERHVANIFCHLGLEQRGGDNRRVLAAITWLRSQSSDQDPSD